MPDDTYRVPNLATAFHLRDDCGFELLGLELGRGNFVVFHFDLLPEIIAESQRFQGGLSRMRDLAERFKYEAANGGPGSVFFGADDTRRNGGRS